LLLGTALAPTDPAVVFLMLGRREVAGRSGTILEGESGANDPVGIALLASLPAAGPAAGLDATGSVAAAFLLRLAVGAAVGVAGGVLLVGFIRRVPLPSEGLYPLRVLAGALVIYGAAALAHGSGFLAVFVAGILAGDARAPTRGRSNDFTCPGQPAEIVAFVVLGLTIGLHTLPDSGALGMGLILAVLLTVVVRPVLVGLLLLPVWLAWGAEHGQGNTRASGAQVLSSDLHSVWHLDERARPPGPVLGRLDPRRGFYAGRMAPPTFVSECICRVKPIPMCW
jgi:cell volume regulation protein A